MKLRQCLRRYAFSLVELLVVITILGVLIAMLLPSLARAREAAIRVTCASRLRQFGVAVLLYANDQKGYFLPSYHSDSSIGYNCWLMAFDDVQWKSFGPVYGIPSDFMQCPASPLWNASIGPGWPANHTSSYFYTGNPEYWARSQSYWRAFSEVPFKTTDGKATSQTFLASCSVYTYGSGFAFAAHSAINWAQHDATTPFVDFTGANQLFADGRVAWKRREQFPATLTAVGGTFGTANFVCNTSSNLSALYW